MQCCTLWTADAMETDALIDSQSVKTVYNSEKRGFDRGKKWHIVKDTMGNLLAVHVHSANIHDTKGGVFTFEEFHNLKVDISERLDSTFKVMSFQTFIKRL